LSVVFNHQFDIQGAAEYSEIGYIFSCLAVCTLDAF